MKKTLIYLIMIFSLLTLWQVSEDYVSRVRISNGDTGLEAFVPSPITIFNTFKKDYDIIFPEIISTLSKAGSGLLLGIFFALLMSVIFIIRPHIRKLAIPILFSINSFPIVGFAPAVILAFGQGSFTSIVFISFLLAYFPLLINIDHAFLKTDKELLNIMKIYNATKLQEITMLRLPLAVPFIFNALKLAIPASIIGATMGEWLGSRHGIGQIITISLYQLKPGLLYASLITISFVSGILVFLVSSLEKRIVNWDFNGDE